MRKKAEPILPPSEIYLKKGPTPQELADEFGTAILDIMLDRTEHYAVRLFQELTAVFDQFPKDSLKFYELMMVLKQRKLVDSRDEVDQIDWEGQRQKVRLRRTLFWKL